jgi:hypothetical protein
MNVAGRLFLLIFPISLVAQSVTDQVKKDFQQAGESVAAVGQKVADLPSQVGPTLTATPFTLDEEFDYRVVQAFGLRAFVGAGEGALLEQARNVPHEWGQGLSGYATRYGSSFGLNLTRQALSFGLESAFHQDPRYFPSKEKGFRSRVKNVLLQTVVARTNSGGEQLAYARIAGAFAAGQLANAWQPRSTSGFGNGLVRSCVMLGGDLGYNFLQEFIPLVRPRSLKHDH